MDTREALSKPAALLFFVRRTTTLNPSTYEAILVFAR